jgi:hypothetical protein
LTKTKWHQAGNRRTTCFNLSGLWKNSFKGHALRFDRSPKAAPPATAPLKQLIPLSFVKEQLPARGKSMPNYEASLRFFNPHFQTHH